MRDVVKIFGQYYKETDRGRRNWVSMKRRRSNPEGARYLSQYLKEYHGVEVDPSTFAQPAIRLEAEAPPPGGIIASTMEGLESETDVELLRRKVVRLAGALAETEKERDSLRRRLAKLEMAVSNIDNVILSDLDSSDDKEQKLQLLKVIFEENKQLREDLGGE